MLRITSQQWSDLFSKPIAVGLLLYLLVGFILAWVIVVRGIKFRRPPTGGMLWEKKDDARNVLFLFQAIVMSSSVIFVVYIAFWPLVLLWLWLNQDENED
jgi:hypothetical protein